MFFYYCQKVHTTAMRVVQGTQEALGRTQRSFIREVEEVWPENKEVQRSFIREVEEVLPENKEVQRSFIREAEEVLPENKEVDQDNKFHMDV